MTRIEILQGYSFHYATETNCHQKTGTKLADCTYLQYAKWSDLQKTQRRIAGPVTEETER